jgi:hypothetical protein
MHCGGGLKLRKEVFYYLEAHIGWLVNVTMSKVLVLFGY